MARTHNSSGGSVAFVAEEQVLDERGAGQDQYATASSVPFNSGSFANRSLISSMLIIPTNPKSELVNASKRLAASVVRHK
ncbi:MAG: hypothetical protein DMG97_36735 [Acidobacteria bacterium]|nr:MAG: hypothetical protein DMG97_36735 [Acidobacteriota bacterium]